LRLFFITNLNINYFSYIYIYAVILASNRYIFMRIMTAMGVRRYSIRNGRPSLTIYTFDI